MPPPPVAQAVVHSKAVALLVLIHCLLLLLLCVGLFMFCPLLVLLCSTYCTF